MYKLVKALMRWSGIINPIVVLFSQIIALTQGYRCEFNQTIGLVILHTDIGGRREGGHRSWMIIIFYKPDLSTNQELEIAVRVFRPAVVLVLFLACPYLFVYCDNLSQVTQSISRLIQCRMWLRLTLT